jgi:hypothetical protein
LACRSRVIRYQQTEDNFLLYRIEFQIKPNDSTRPLDHAQDDEILVDDGAYFPVPVVGDTITATFRNKPGHFKVLSRHFSYASEQCLINIVVSPVSDEEMAGRLKE